MPTPRGTLFLVVGPSGAGKDSLIDGANRALRLDDSYMFPCRYITRPADAGGEDHIAVSLSEFDTLFEAGDMLMEWHAHDLRYGVPSSVDVHLNTGGHVIVNVSRTVVAVARDAFQPMKVLYITVSDDVLRERLSARGRETPADIEKRVARAREYMLQGEDVALIDNGGQLEESVATFVQAIKTP